MRSYLVLVSLPLLADLLDRFIAWAQKRYRQEIKEGDEFPAFAWILWVRITHLNPDYDHDLWIVKLPSWRWGRIAWDGSEGWTQFALFNRGPFQRRELFNGNGWQSGWVVVR